MKRIMAALMAVILAIFFLSGCGGSGGNGGSGQQEAKLNYNQASEKLAAYISSGKVASKTVNHTADPSWVGSDNVKVELPPIDKYPLSVNGSGQLNVEIFSSTEKSATNGSGWLDIMAKKFNGQNNKLNGKTVSVSIRPIASGLAFDYITSQTYKPDAYTPSNELWSGMMESSGVMLQTIEKSLTGNTAGISMEKKTYEAFIKKYGEVTIDNAVKAVLAGDLVLGHTDPNVSSTGLNIFTQELRSLDPGNPFSEKAITGLRQFQSLIPPASPTTAEMAKVAQKGILNAVIMESQAASAYQELSDWVFTPCGVRHDSPLYGLGELSADKAQTLKMFADFCKSSDSQKSATDLGFNKFSGYKGVDNKYSGRELLAALKTWKENKDGGSPIVSIFLVDRSGSMDGNKISKVKSALNGALRNINPNNYIGLVSFSSVGDVTIDLPVEKFNAKQQSLFAGAVKDFKANGGTATNSALVVALDQIVKASKSVPNAKLRVFILSDGEQNEGLALGDVLGIVSGLKVSVYGIGFEANLKDLQKLADVNEGYCINADSQDVVYKLSGLFNAQL